MATAPGRFAQPVPQGGEAVTLTAWHGLEPAEAAHVAGCLLRLKSGGWRVGRDRRVGRLRQVFRRDGQWYDKFTRGYWKANSAAELVCAMST